MALVFLVMKKKKNIHFKCREILWKHIDLLLIEEKYIKLYVLIRDFKTFMYDDTFHHGRKHFCHYCFKAFSTEEILSFDLISLKLMVNKPFRWLKKVNMLNSKIMKEK